MFNLENFISRLKNGFFIELLLLFFTIYFLMFSIKHRNKFQELRLIYLYPLTSLIFHLENYMLYVSKEDIEAISIANLNEKLFLSIEFTLLTYPLMQSLSGLKRTLSIMFLTLFFISFFYLSYIGKNENLGDSTIIYYQILFIICIASLKIIDFFSRNSNYPLINDPIFWITIGIYVFFLSIIPVYQADKYIFLPEGLIKIFKAYNIIYIFYMILFALIIRSFLCIPIVKK